MKFKMSKARLSNALKTVQSVVGTKTSLQILQNVKIDVGANDDGTGKITLMATDLDTTLIIDDTCEVSEAGSTTLPVRLLAPAVSKVADGMVEVDVNDSHKAQISAGSASFKVAGITADEFPRITNEEATLTCTFKQNQFASMLKMVVFAASIDDTRRTLKGTLMSFKDGELTLVSTDGRRLAVYKKATSYEGADADIIVPAKTVSELLRSLGGNDDFKIVVHGTGMVEFDMGNVRLMSKLIEDAYPNYRQVIPASRKYKIEIDRKMLYDSVDRVSLFADETTKSCRLTFANNQLLLRSASGDMGEGADSVPVKYSGEQIEAMFNPYFINDILKPMEEDEVVIEIDDGRSPAVFRTSEESFCVLMPLRVQ